MAGGMVRKYIYTCVLLEFLNNIHLSFYIFIINNVIYLLNFFNYGLIWNFSKQFFKQNISSYWQDPSSS